MSSWRKLLVQMVADGDPRSYTYGDAAKVLRNLGFAEPRKKGSHRHFRIELPDASAPKGSRSVTVGLVEAGSGTLNPEYIKDMIQILRLNGLLGDITDRGESEG